MTLSNCLRACLLIGVLFLCVSCRQQETATASDIVLELSPADLRVGGTTMALRVADRDGKPVSQPGKLTLRGDMNHAGMMPVIAESGASDNGVFIVPFEWTMGGSWQVKVRLELPNGEIASQTFNYDITSEGSAAYEHDMQGEGMGMDSSDISGANSAAYMRIQNQSGEDIVLVTVASDASQSASFHHTQIVDGIARMTQMRELVVPARGEIQLAPGGMHLMLHGVTRDLSPDSRFAIVLTDSAGKSYRMPVLVSERPLADANDDTRIHDLGFMGRWAHPASES